MNIALSFIIAFICYMMISLFVVYNSPYPKQVFTWKSMLLPSTYVPTVLGLMVAAIIVSDASAGPAFVAILAAFVLQRVLTVLLVQKG